MKTTGVGLFKDAACSHFTMKKRRQTKVKRQSEMGSIRPPSFLENGLKIRNVRRQSLHYTQKIVAVSMYTRREMKYPFFIEEPKDFRYAARAQKSERKASFCRLLRCHYSK